MEYTFGAMTPEEVREYRDQQRRVEEQRQADRQRERAIALVKHATLVALAVTPALKAVVKHHEPVMGKYDTYPLCYGCDPGDYAEGFTSWPCGTINLIEEHLQEEAATAEPTVTDRLLAGGKVIVIGPRLTRSMDFITEVAENLRATGHHITSRHREVCLDNGGELLAATEASARGSTADHVIILGAVPDEHVTPILATGGTISRR